MHNTWSRISNVFSFFTTVVTTIACAIALIHLVTTPTPNIKNNSLTLNNVQVVKGRPYWHSSKREEFAHIKFSLDVDLSTLFNWNTKQIFLYITATHPSTSNPNSEPSQSILWDAILPHPNSPPHHNHYINPTSKTSEKSSSSKGKSKRGTSRDRTKDTNKKTQQPQVPGLLRLEGQRPKYQITDPSGRLAERSNVTLELNWNIQPWVGALTWFSAGSESAMVNGGAGGRRPHSGDRGILGLLPYIGAWNRLKAEGARSEQFDLPGLKDKAEGVKVEKGSEGYKLMG